MGVLMANHSELAINGGPPVRRSPLPYRKQFDEDALKKVTEVFEDSWKEGVDFGFQGKYENIYTDNFCEFMGEGYADAVCSGTAGIHLALKALDIENGSDVIVSPVTDPGSIAPAMLLGFNLVIADSKPDSFSIGSKQFEEAITQNTRAAILTHIGGHPIDLDPIMEIAQAKDIKIIEDCSQAHGALYKGKMVGRFGDIAVFSTMFSKNHATGGTGGIVYTTSEEYYRKVRPLADRGKPFFSSDFDLRNPADFLFPSLNFNLDELSCAIGITTLSKLPTTIKKKLEIAKKINQGLEKSSVVFPCRSEEHSRPSIYFHTVEVDLSRLKISKEKFATAIAAEGIWINPNYKYLASEWGWISNNMDRPPDTPNAVNFRNRTFNILFNEKFKDKEIQDILECIYKVESVYKR